MSPALDLDALNHDLWVLRLSPGWLFALKVDCIQHLETSDVT